MKSLETSLERTARRSNWLLNNDLRITEQVTGSQDIGLALRKAVRAAYSSPQPDLSRAIRALRSRPFG